MKNYPETSADWNNPRKTLYREFKFESLSDIQILQELVEQNINKDNNLLLRSRLLGILNYYYDRANQRASLKSKYPKTWLLRYYFIRIIQFWHRRFYTRTFKTMIIACTLNNLIKQKKQKLI